MEINFAEREDKNVNVDNYKELYNKELIKTRELAAKALKYGEEGNEVVKKYNKLLIEHKELVEEYKKLVIENNLFHKLYVKQ